MPTLAQQRLAGIDLRKGARATAAASRATEQREAADAIAAALRLADERLRERLDSAEVEAQSRRGRR